MARVFLVLAFYLFVGQSSICARSLDWPLTSEDASRSNLLSLQLIETFLSDLLSREELPAVRVQEFRFSSLTKGSYQLIATIDSSGRDMFSNVVVVWLNVKGMYGYKVLPSDPPHLLASELIDFKGEGISVLVTKRLASGYLGSNSPLVFWYDLSSLENNRIVSVAAKYPVFYQRLRLPELIFLKHSLVSSDAGNSDAPTVGMLVESVQYKYLRQVFHQPSAGLQAALKWAKSPNAKIQMLAVEALAEIGDGVALSTLKNLQHSSNEGVSQAATNALDALFKASHDLPVK